MQIVNKSNGRSVMARTVDSCESCTYNDIGKFKSCINHTCFIVASDMSPSAFNAISSLDVGQITVDWHFMNKAYNGP